MSEIRKPPAKAAGKNDVWFALFFITAIVVAGLIPRHPDASEPNHPAPVSAATLKE